MDGDEMVGRLIVLETMVVATLRLMMTQPGQVYSPERAVAVLNAIQRCVESEIYQKAERYSQGAKVAAFRYLDHVCAEFSEHLIPKRPSADDTKSSC